MTRRETFKLIATASMASGFTWAHEDVRGTNLAMQTAPASTVSIDDFEPAFFTAHELETVKILVDMIIPADDRSGSATEAGVPQFMDFMMTDRPPMQLPMRGGLAWIDYQCSKRFGDVFSACTEEQRIEMLDAIAYPEIAAPELSQGVAFFNSFRDLTASGFWSSKMGVDDLQYIGNTFVPEWTGTPPDIIEQLGVQDV